MDMGPFFWFQVSEMSESVSSQYGCFSSQATQYGGSLNQGPRQYDYNFQPNALLFSLKDETKYDLTHTISKYMKNVQVCESYFMSYYFILITTCAPRNLVQHYGLLL